MKKITRNILIISSGFMAAGIIFTGIGLASGGIPGLAITPHGVLSASDSPEPYRLEKTAIDTFKETDININSEADITLLPSDDENFYLEYSLDGDYGSPQWDVTNGKITLSQGSNSTGGFSVGNSQPFIRLYIPEGTRLSSLNIYNDYGDLDLDGITADTCTASLNYGDMEMENCSFDTVEIELESGDLDAAGSSVNDLTLTNYYGDSTLEDMTVVNGDFTIDSGDLLLDADGLESMIGSNDYGDTTLILADELDSYSFALTTEFGEIALPQSAMGRLDSDYMEMHYTQKGKGNRSVAFTAASGNITLKTD